MSAELTQIDIDNVRKWMPWHLRKYYEGEHTSVMSLLEDITYRRLLDAMWMTQTPVGTMPQDDRQIATLAKVPLSVWRKVKDQVLKCFVDGGDGRWHQPDQKQVWKEQCEKYITARTRAMAGGKARAANALLKQSSSSKQAGKNGAKSELGLSYAPLAPDSLLREGDGQPPLDGGASAVPTIQPRTVADAHARQKADLEAHRATVARLKGGVE